MPEMTADTDPDPESAEGEFMSPLVAPPTATVSDPARRNALLDLAVEQDPAMEPIATAAKADIRVAPDGTLIISDTLRAAMRALVPRPDQASPGGEHRRIGDWLTASNIVEAVTETSPYFTVSHWHWLAATGKTRRMPSELGPTFPYLMTSEAQIAHDLTAWGALDAHGQLTEEAEEMFKALTGHAELTVFGTVLLYAQRRDPVKVPPELAGFGLEAAVRNVPRVTFVIGVTAREVVSALVNNITVVVTRRLRRAAAADDAAVAVRDLLDPEQQWPAYPLPSPIVLSASVVDTLAGDKDCGKLIDSEPVEDASDAEREIDAEMRNTMRKAIRRVLQQARTPAAAQESIAEIASSTTHALAQITASTSEVDVPRGAPSALALAFLRDRGIVASYPSGSGNVRRITYASGNVSGIAVGIKALISAYNGG